MAEMHDEKVKQLEAEVEDAKPTLEEACSSFVDAVAAALPDFWPNYVTSCVEHARDDLADLGGDQVRDLKSKVDGIVAEPREVAEREIVGPGKKLWPHLADADDLVRERGAGYGRFSWISRSGGTMLHPPEEITRPVNYAAGAPANPLMDADLPTPGDRPWDGKVSAELDWTGDMEDALRAYNVAARELMEKVQSLAWAREERDKAEAVDRWEQA